MNECISPKPQQITSVAVLVKFWTHEIFPNFCLKFRQNFRRYFASFRSYFPAPQTISWAITFLRYFLSDIFIFFLILK